jgi:hypothetical protein
VVYPASATCSRTVNAVRSPVVMSDQDTVR